MNDVVAAVSADEMRQRIKRKSRLKGRQADDASLAEVRALLGTRPANGWPRDRLIEHLHLLNDAYRGWLTATRYRPSGSSSCRGASPCASGGASAGAPSGCTVQCAPAGA